MDEMNVQIIAAEIVRRVPGSPDSAHNLARVVAGFIEQEMERGKKRVVFKFDERSLESRQEFEALARSNGWKLIEVETVNGTILIPDLM